MAYEPTGYVREFHSADDFQYWHAQVRQIAKTEKRLAVLEPEAPDRILAIPSSAQQAVYNDHAARALYDMTRTMRGTVRARYETYSPEIRRNPRLLMRELEKHFGGVARLSRR